MAPYEPNPYRSASNTGLAQLLAQQDKQNREVAREVKIDRIMDEVSYLRHRVEDLDYKFNAPVAIVTPEPSVEEDIETPSWISKMLTSGFWEIFKRPTL
jgi:hypothetical protein